MYKYIKTEAKKKEDFPTIVYTQQSSLNYKQLTAQN